MDPLTAVNKISVSSSCPIFFNPSQPIKISIFGNSLFILSYPSCVPTDTYFGLNSLMFSASACQFLSAERAVILNLSRFSRIIERAFLPMLPVAPSIEMFVCMSSPN